MKRKENIVIIGGGFAGVNAAKKILQINTNSFVTLVDRNNYNFFPPLLYQVATGFLDVSNISYPYRKYFRGYSNFRFFMGELLEVQPETNTIVLSTGLLTYDRLIIATGTTSNFFGNENIRRNALPMKTISDALLLKNTLLERFEEAARITDPWEIKKLTTIVIAGGGPTGVEIAGMLAGLRKDVIPKDYPSLKNLPFNIYVLDGLPTLLAPMSKASQQYTLKSLQDMGVIIKLNQLVKDFIDDTVFLGDGTTIETKNLLWTAGVTAQVFKGIQKEFHGRGQRLIVDGYNQVTGTANIYAIGDTCIQTADQKFPNGHPQLAQVAIQQGTLLAKNLYAETQQKKKKLFAYNDKGSMAIIGRNKAVAELAAPKLHFSGFIAWLMWLFVHLLSLIHFRNKIKTCLSWISAYASKDQYLRMIIKPASKES